MQRVKVIASRVGAERVCEAKYFYKFIYTFLTMENNIIPVSDFRVLLEYADGSHIIIPVDTNQCPSFSSLIVYLHKEHQYDPSVDKIFTLKLM